MISSIFLTNKFGRLLIFRAYREGNARHDAQLFSKNIIELKFQPYRPVHKFGFATYFRVTVDGFHLVASCCSNVNAALVMQFLLELKRSIVALLDSPLREINILDHSTQLYEMLDIGLDAGRPQDYFEHYLNANVPKDSIANLFRRHVPDVTNYLEDYGVDCVKLHRGQRMVAYTDEHLAPSSDPELDAIKVAVPWRPDGITCRKNEVSVTVSECINCCYSHAGELLFSEVTGSLTLDCQLSGRPTLEIHLNADFSGAISRNAHRYMESKNESDFSLPLGAKVAASMVDFKVDKTVNINVMLATKRLTLVPPQGSTALMLYRCAASGPLPFDINPVLTRTSRQLLYYHLTVKSKYVKKVCATNVVLRVPLPENAASVDIANHAGHCQAKLAMNHVLWTLGKAPGESSFTLEFQCKVAQSVVESEPVLGAISVEFSLPNFSFSGLYVRSMSLSETPHTVGRSVQYVSRNGEFQYKLRYPS